MADPVSAEEQVRIVAGALMEAGRPDLAERSAINPYNGRPSFWMPGTTMEDQRLMDQAVRVCGFSGNTCCPDCWINGTYTDDGEHLYCEHWSDKGE